MYFIYISIFFVVDILHIIKICFFICFFFYNLKCPNMHIIKYAHYFSSYISTYALFPVFLCIFFKSYKFKCQQISDDFVGNFRFCMRVRCNVFSDLQVKGIPPNCMHRRRISIFTMPVVVCPTTRARKHTLRVTPYSANRMCARARSVYACVCLFVGRRLAPLGQIIRFHSGSFVGFRHAAGSSARAFRFRFQFNDDADDRRNLHGKMRRTRRTPTCSTAHCMSPKTQR